MKARVARRIVRAVENGYASYNLQVIRQAAFMAGRPLELAVGDYDTALYFPKGMKGEFVRVTKYRPDYVSGIVRLSKSVTVDSLKSHYDYVRKIEQAAGTIILDVSAGSHISSAATLASDLARQLGAVVRTEFNGIPVVARPHSTGQSVYDAYNAESKRRSEAYRNSDEYKEYQRKRAEQVAASNAKVAELLASLDGVIHDEAAMMQWVYDLATVADDVDVPLDYAALSKRLTDGGWVANAHVISKETDEATAEVMKTTIENDKSLTAQWVIGQVISCLNIGMPPHQVTMHFVDKYFDRTPPEPEDEFEDFDGEADEAEENLELNEAYPNEEEGEAEAA